MWQPDGWAQTRIGVVTPELDVNPEAEFRALAGVEISIHAARVRQKTYDSREAPDGKIASDRCERSPNLHW
jgi:maleate cis-trans isomerase